MLPLDAVLDLVGGKFGRFDVACPFCGPGRKEPRNRTRRVLRIWCERADFATYICARCGLAGYASDGLEKGSPRPGRLPASAGHNLEADARRTERALVIWDQAQSFAGSLAERYLAARGVSYSGEALRFHPACHFGPSECHPAMLALMRNAITNRPQGIHRTSLLPDGSGKAGPRKMMLGPSAGAVIKLTDDADVTQVLAVGEGIETTLALRNLPDLSTMPVWAALSAGTMKTFPVLAGIESLWIAADHDPAGILAARACGGRWRDAGREVFIISPNATGADLADIIGGPGDV